jgi:hypothetical protein
MQPPWIAMVKDYPIVSRLHPATVVPTMLLKDMSMATPPLVHSAVA